MTSLHSARPVDDVEHGEGPRSDGEEDELQHHVVPVAPRASLPVWLRGGEHLLSRGLCPDLAPAEGTAQGEEDDHVADQRTEGEGDAGETPQLQVGHSCSQLRDVATSQSFIYLRQTEACPGWPS